MGERKIAISIDGSKPSDCAFEWYLTNMKRDKDMVVLIHCPEYHVHMGLPGVTSSVDEITKGMTNENKRIDSMMGSYVDKLRAHEVHGQVVLKQGKPGEAIVTVAEEQHVSAIVMGSRGLGTIRRTLMGSVSDYVVKHAPAHCSVTIIRDS